MRTLLFTGCLLAAVLLRAQPESPAGLLFRISYGYQLPGADLADRFGGNFSLGGGLEWITGETSWMFGLDGQFLFGSQVKTDVLAGLRTPEGYLYGNDRAPADVALRERGFYAGAHAGKILPLSAVNPRSGLLLRLGAGLLQHQIRIQDDPVRSVPQIEDEYKKGYDRLTNGPALQQLIGYQLLDPEGRINFYLNLEFIQGFTRNRRDFNFDTRETETDSRLDLLFGFRLGWILPFYVRRSDQIYY